MAQSAGSGFCQGKGCDGMRLNAEVIQLVSQEVVHLLLQTQSIAVDEAHIRALESALSSMMLEHFENEERAKWAARALLERRGLDVRSLAETMHEVAKARGFSVGEDGITDLVTAMVRRIETMANVTGNPPRNVLLRSKVVSVLAKHLEVDAGQEDARPKLRLSKPLVMTPQLQQAIRLLQLSHEELMVQVQQEMEQNPFLDQLDTAEGDPSEKTPGEASLEADTAEEAPEEPIEDLTRAPVFGGDEGRDQIEQHRRLNSLQFGRESTAAMAGVGESDEPASEAHLANREDIRAHLGSSVRLLKLNDAERRVAHLIIGNLDDDGYLRIPDVEGDPLIGLASEADVELSLAERTLRKVQRLDPKGCGARDLQECLLVQVSVLNDPRAALLGMMIQRHLETLEKKDLNAIATDLRVPVEEVLDAWSLLETLDPKPGRGRNNENARYITPDVFVYRIGDGYTVVLNDEMSALRITPTYRQALRKGALLPGGAKEFLMEKLRSAMWFIRSIHQRQRLIYKVTESIVKLQEEFLARGTAHRKPVLFRDVAEDIGMHESTVRRGVIGKYVHTPQGIYPLAYFFSTVVSLVPGEDIPAERVKQHIQRIIDEEDTKNPYSDREIAALLLAQGLDVARRAVAKYRELLGVLPPDRRKQ
jgi:RNA polymerase sigma-54 factor